MISIRHLSKTYKRGKVAALKNINLEIGEGEVIGLIGPNGAGKTTLMECMLGLVWPTAGEIEIAGFAPTRLEARELTAFLPERPNYDPWMNPVEFLSFHYALATGKSPGARSVITEALDQVALAPEARKRAMKTFSKGMLQRIALAQMLIAKPRICFMDEPTSGLDPISRNLVRDIIKRWREEKVTVVLNSHNLDEVERVCDRVAFVFNGTISALEEHKIETELIPVAVRILGPDDAAARINEIASQLGINVAECNNEFTRFIITSKTQLPVLIRALVNAQLDIEQVFVEKTDLQTLFEQNWRQSTK